MCIRDRSWPVRRAANVKGSIHCHRHRPLEGGDLVARSAAYPRALCREWVKVILGDDPGSDEGGQ
eukprot:4342895-Alexandrium_andersonii.AAC.1